MKKLILRNFQSPGDIVMLTAAVRDLHKCHPGQFLTDVRTPCPELWQNNPYLTPLSEDDPEVEVMECHYPLIHQSNYRPYHFIHGFMDYLSGQLGLDIRPTEFRGDIHISEEEKQWFVRVEDQIGSGDALPFWLVTAGGKNDYTIKWWSHERYQKVVDHFRGRVEFVQVGEGGHHHPPLEGVVDLRGQTDLRMLIRLMYHAEGALSPVSLLMHLAAAVPVKVGMPQNRPCVVVAGGREPPQWEAYPHHQFIHTVGQLRCCDQGGCWKSRTKPLGDGDDKDNSLCVDVVGDLPHCMDMISADEVIRRIEGYYEGRALPARPADPRRPVARARKRPTLAFATSLDENFLPGARGLIRSIRKFYPVDEADIVIYTDVQDTAWQQFAREHGVSVLRPDSVRPWAVPLIYDDPHYLGDTRHSYHPAFTLPPEGPDERPDERHGFGEIAHLDAMRLKDYAAGYCLLIKGYEKVVQIDSDAFLLAPLDEMFARHDGPDNVTAFRDQPEGLPHLRALYGVNPPSGSDLTQFSFNAGVIFYWNGPGTRQMLQDLLFYLESPYHYQHSGFVDQGVARNVVAKHVFLGNIRFHLEDNASWNPDWTAAEELEQQGDRWVNVRNGETQHIYHTYARPKLWHGNHPSPSVNAAWRWVGGEYVTE